MFVEATVNKSEKVLVSIGKVPPFVPVTIANVLTVNAPIWAIAE